MQQPRESILVPSGYLYQRPRLACLRGSDPERFQILFLSVTTDYEDPPETRTIQPVTDIRHKGRHDLRPDRDGAGKGLSDLRQAVGKQRRYEALGSLGRQLPACALAEFAGRKEVC